jgi:uncharacterized protein YaaN involved in tellurite resistance
MSQTTTATATDSALILTPPEPLEVVSATKAAGAVKLPQEKQAEVEKKVEGFLASLLQGDPNSDDFKSNIDKAFSVGRTEIAASTTLSNHFTKKNFVGAEDTPAYKAISSMRTLFDDLNPATQGDLFTPTRFLGIPVPWGNKLVGYLRRYQSAETQLGAISGQLLAANDEVAKDVAAMGLARQQMWGAMEKLEAASHFIRSLDEKLSAHIDLMKSSDPDRARIMEQEVLYYVRQNLGDLMAAQALAINAYNVMGELRKTGRETINGCDRVMTLGMAALSVAVTLARATGNQIATQKMLAGSKQEIENLIASTGQALNTHVDMTTQFSSNPVLGVQTLQSMFDKTFEAMDKMDKYRSEALSTMQQNNQMLRGEITKAQDRINRERQAAPAAAVVATAAGSSDLTF